MSTLSKSSFRVEALEHRILLSATAMGDGASADLSSADAEETPQWEVEERSEEEMGTLQNEGTEDTEDSLYASAVAVDVPGYSESLDLRGTGELTLTSDGTLLDRDGNVLASDASSITLTADAVVLSDGFSASGVSISADSITVGSVVWSGENVLTADSVGFVGKMTAAEGASLILEPMDASAPIALGAGEAGFLISTEELARLSDAGLDDLIIGAEDGSHAVTIDGLQYRGDLLLRAPAEGGHFDILSTVHHSGGTLRYAGPGHTQETSADTITEGSPIFVGDSVLIEAGAYSESLELADAVYLNTTFGNNPAGADITITGSVSGETGDEILYLNAGTGGTIRIQGAVGVDGLLSRIVIVNAKDVYFGADVELDSFQQQAGTGSTTFGTALEGGDVTVEGDLGVVTAGNITFHGELHSASGNVSLDSDTGKILVVGNTDLDTGDFTIPSADDVEFRGGVDVAGNLLQETGTGTTLFESTVQAADISVRADAAIRFRGIVQLLSGDLFLVSNEIDFLGGVSTVNGAADVDGSPISELVLRPISPEVSIDIGSPVGGTGELDLSAADVAALADGFAGITIGYSAAMLTDIGFTGTASDMVRMGGSTFLDPAVVHGQAFFINGNVNGSTSLLLHSRTGAIDIRASQVRVSNEQIGSTWQSSKLTLLSGDNILLRDGGSLRITNHDDADLSQGSLIELNASSDITNQSGSLGRVIARELEATAVGAIQLRTQVEMLQVASTGAGVVSIDELDGIQISSATTADGAIALTTGGDTALTRVESLTDDAANDIALLVFNGDAWIAQMLAGEMGDIDIEVEAGSLTGLSAGSAPHLIADVLTLETANGAGESESPLRIAVNELHATNLTTGPATFAQDASRPSLGVTIDNGATDETGHVTLTVAGSAPVRVLAGGISSQSSAGILLDVPDSLEVGGSVHAEGGPITFEVTTEIELLSGVEVDSGGGDIFVSGTEITMDATSAIVSRGADIFLGASTGAVVIGTVDARGTGSDPAAWGEVAVRAVTDIEGHQVSGANVYGSNISLIAGTGIGGVAGNQFSLGPRPLIVEADTLAARTTSGLILIHGIGDLTTGFVGGFVPTVAVADGTIGIDASTGNVSAILNDGGEDIVLSVENLLTVDSGGQAPAAVATTGVGSVILVAHSIIATGSITSLGGVISLAATGDIEISDAADIRTTNAAEIAIASSGGSVDFGAGSEVTTDTGSVVIAAAAGMTLGMIATQGSVGLRSTNGGIRAATGGTDSRIVVQSPRLTLAAADTVSGPSGSDLPFSLDVDSLSIVVSDGVEARFLNQGALTVESTEANVTLFDRFQLGASLTLGPQAGLTVGEATDLELVVVGGDLILAETTGTLALGSGDLHLQASAIHVNAGITGSGGSFLLEAADDLTLAAGHSIETTATGSITIEAGGDIQMGTGGSILSDAGAISISANTSVHVAQIVSESGTVSVISVNGSIVDADPAELAVDITTSETITLTAATGIGFELTRHSLTIIATSIAASTGSGGIFLFTPETLRTTSLISTQDEAPIVLESAGSITIASVGTNPAISSAGNLALTAADDLWVQGQVNPIQGSMSLLAGNDLILESGIELFASGSIRATATTGAFLQGNGGTIEADGDIALSAGTDLTLAHVTTGQNVSLQAGTVSDGAPGSTDPRIEATGLLLNGVGDFGTVANPMPISIGRLAGDVTGGTLSFSNDRDLVLGTLTVTTSPVDTASGALLADITGTANILEINGTAGGVFVVVAGDLTVDHEAEATLTVGSELPLLIQSTGDQLWSGRFAGANGLTTVRVGGNLTTTASGMYSTGGGDLHLDVAGTWTHGIDAVFDLGSGSILANVAGAIILDGAISGATDAALLSQGEIGPSSVTPVTNVTADNLILNSPIGIGSSVSPLRTAVDQLTAHGGAQGVHLLNTKSLSVTNLGFVIPSLLPGGASELAFSGQQGGAITSMAGAINLEVEGALTVDSVRASVVAFPGDTYSLLFLSRVDGTAGNELIIRFDDSETGTPVTADYDADGRQLTVTYEAGQSTWADILAAIQAEASFPADAVLISGSTDGGSDLFAPDPTKSFIFVTEGGMAEGVLASAATEFDGGAAPVPAVAELPFVDRFYSIRFTAKTPGAAANGIEIRLLDDGPSGRLDLGANAADVVWNEGEQRLDLYVNFGFTTVGVLLDALSASEAPFEATLSGAFDADTRNETFGDAPVLLESDLHASTVVRIVGTNNDLALVATQHGSLYNGVEIVLIDDGLAETMGARAVFDSTTNLLKVFVASERTTANEVLAAINEEGTFTATLLNETGGNNGTGVVQAQQFLTHSGAAGQKAEAVLSLSGPANDFVLTAVDFGADFNGIRVVFINDDTLASGTAKAQYDASSATLSLTVNSLFTATSLVIQAINGGPNAATIPFTASLAPANSGLGSITLWTAAPTSGGVSGPARATFAPVGSNNDFFIIGDTSSPGLQNVPVYLYDDGTMTGGAAAAVYDNTARRLLLNVQSGVTTLNTLLEAINTGPTSETIPYTASLVSGNDGTGVFNLNSQETAGGTDPVPATATVTLPSGVDLVLEADILDFLDGGVPANGITVSFAIDSALESGTASAELIETSGPRLLNIHAADSLTTIAALAAALEAASLPFTIANFAEVNALTVGSLAPTSTETAAGHIEITTSGDVTLLGGIRSATGGLHLDATNLEDDLTFGTPDSTIEVFNRATIVVTGSVANLGSTATRTIAVFGGDLSVATGASTRVSTQSLIFFAEGAVTLSGSGLSVTSADIIVDAGTDVLIQGPLSVTTGAIDIEAADDLIVEHSLTASQILLVSGTALDIHGALSADVSISLTAGTDITQTAEITATDIAGVTLKATTGSILMSGAASTSTASGAIDYLAGSNIEVTTISSISGAITLISGGAITDVTAARTGVNLTTTGSVLLQAQTGIGGIGDEDMRTNSGHLILRNLGATGNIVVTEIAAGTAMTVGSINHAENGWTLLTTEGGNIEITDSITHTETGALLLISSGDILIESEITLTGGVATLTAAGSIELEKDVTTNGADFAATAGTGTFVMAPEATLDAGGGTVVLTAAGNILLSQIRSIGGDIRLVSATGSLLRSEPDEGSPLGRTNLIGAAAHLIAGAAIGSFDTVGSAITTDVSRLAASASNGGIALAELSGLAIGASTIAIDTAQADASTVEVSAEFGQLLSGSGAVVMDVAGSLIIEALPDAHTVVSGGNLRLDATAGIVIAGDIQIDPGAFHLKSGSIVSIAGSISTAGGSLLMEAGSFFFQGTGSTIQTNGGNIVIAAGNNLTVNQLDAGTGAIALTSATSLARNVGTVGPDLSASRIRLSAGMNVGTVARALRVDSAELSASAGGLIRIDAIGDLTIEAVEVGANRVSALGATSAGTVRTEASQADLSTTQGGNILLGVTGLLRVNDGNTNALGIVATAGGHISIVADSLIAAADLNSADGHITIVTTGNASWEVVPESAPDAGDGLAAKVHSATGDIMVKVGGTITMTDTTFFRTLSGNISIDTGGDILVSSLRAGEGFLSLNAGGAILDNGDAELDLVANTLRVVGGSLGSFSAYNSLETQVNRLAARITSGAFALVERDGLEIGAASGVVSSVNLAAVIEEKSFSTLMGLDSRGGGSVSVSTNGALTLLSNGDPADSIPVIAVTNAGNLHLAATGTMSQLTVDDALTLGTGHVTMLANGDITFATDVSVTTSGAGSMTIDSAIGRVIQHANGSFETVAGDIAIRAFGDVEIAEVATEAGVAITSLSGAIVDNNDTALNISAETLRFQASGSIATALDPFETAVDIISAFASNGGIFLLEADGLVVGETSSTTSKVGADSGTEPFVFAAQSDLTTGGANGTIIVRTVDGNLLLSPGGDDDGVAVSAHGTGNILLEAGGDSDLVAEANILSGQGHISLAAGAALTLAPAVRVTTSFGGNIEAIAAAGALTSGAESRFISQTGTIRLVAHADLLLGGLSTGGNASLISETGSIRSAGSTGWNEDVVANQLRLSAAQDIGQVVAGGADPLRTEVGRLAAVSTQGSIYIRESTHVTVNAVTAIVQRVGADGTLTAVTDTALADLVIGAGDGNLVLSLDSGTFTLLDGGDGDGIAVSTVGAGNILLEAGAATSDLVIEASIQNGTGHISLIGGASVTVGDGVTVETSGEGTIAVVAGTFTAADSSRVVSADGDIYVAAEGNLIVGGFTTGSDVALISATGSILDAGDDGGVDVVAQTLLIVADASIGWSSSIDAIETTVATVAGRSTAGNFALVETDGLTVGHVAPIATNLVQATGEALPLVTAALNDIEGNGAVVLRSLAGNLIVTDGEDEDGFGVRSIAGGNLLLAAEGAAGSLVLDASVDSDGGHLTLTAGDAISVNGTASIVTTASGTIFAEASAGNITLAPGASMVATLGNIRLSAAHEIILGRLATAGNVSISSVNGSILNGGVDGDLENISAQRLAIRAAGSIGEIGVGAAPLTTDITRLAAIAGVGGVHLVETDGLRVDSVTTLVQKVQNDGTSVSVTDPALANVTTTVDGAHILIQVEAGNLALAAVGQSHSILAAGSGNIRLDASSSSGNLEILQAIESGTGHITLKAGHSVLIGGDVEISTAGGTIYVVAATGGIEADDNSRLISTLGDVSLEAGEDVLVGGITTAGHVSLASINGSILTAGSQFGGADIVAASLRLEAGEGIGILGTGVKPLTLSVDTVAASTANGPISLVELDEVVVGAAGATVLEVLATGATQSHTFAELRSLTTTGGAIVLQVLEGTLTVESGIGTAAGVSANGVQNVRLEAKGLDGDVLLNGTVLSGGGHVSILATRTVNFAANAAVRTSLSGTIDVEAVGDSLIMADGARIIATLGDVRLRAQNDVLVGGVQTSGAIAVTALAGSILDQGDAHLDLRASALRLVAANGIGTLGTDANSLEILTATLSARAGSGGMNLLASDSITVGDVSAAVQKVATDGTASSVVEALQSDLRTAGNGSIVLRLLDGNAVLEDGSALDDSVAVSAHGTGNILIETLGLLRVIDVMANLISGGGNISLLASLQINIGQTDAAATVQTGSAGTIDLDASGEGIAMGNTSKILSASGDIRLRARGDIVLGGIVSDARVSVTSEEGQILDAGSPSVNIEAVGTRLSAFEGIGTGQEPIRTRTSVLTAHVAAGNLNLLEASTVTIADVSAAVQRVGADATTTVITDEAQSDLRTSGANGWVILRSLVGTITLTDGTVLADGTVGSDNTAVSAHGSGRILIETLGSGQNIFAQAALLSTSGDISLIAANSVVFSGAGHVVTGSAGTIFVAGTSGNVTQADLLRLTADNGDIRVLAGQTISLNGISTAGHVSLIAQGGSVLDNRETSTVENIVANQLRLQAGGGVGTAAAPLATLVATVSGRAGSGGIHLKETDELIIGTTSSLVRRTHGDGTFAAINDSAQSDLSVTGNGGIVVETGGLLTLNDGNANGEAVTAATGSISLTTFNGGDLVVNAAITSTTGALILASARDITVNDTGLTAGGTLTLASVRHLSVIGAITTGGAATFEIGGDLHITGTNASGGDVALTVGGTSTIDGAVLVTGDFTLTGVGAVDLRDDFELAGAFTVTGESILLTGAFDAGTTVNLAAVGGLAIVGELAGETAVSLSSGTTLASSGTLTAGGTLTVAAGTSAGLAGIITVGGVTAMTVGGDLHLEGTFTGSDQATIGVTGTTTVDATISLHGLLLTGTGAIDLRDDLEVTDDLTINAGATVLISGTLAVGGSVAVTAIDRIDIQADAVVGSNITLQSDTVIATTGILDVAGAFVGRSAGDTSLDGMIGIDGTTDLSAGGALLINGTFTAGGHVTGDATGSITWTGVLAVTGDLSLTSLAAIDLSNDVEISHDAIIDGATTVAISGLFAVGNRNEVHADGAMNLNGTFSSGENSTLVSGADLSLTGTLTVGGALIITSTGNATVDGTVDVVGASNSTVGGNLWIAGLYSVDGDTTLTVTGETTIGTVTTGATMTIGGNLMIDGIGAIDLRDAIVVGGNATFDAGSLLTLAGTVTVNEILTIEAADAVRLEGSFSSGANLLITGQADLVQSGSLVVGGDLELIVEGAADLDGTVEIDGLASLSAGDGFSLSGTFESTGTTTVTVIGATEVNAIVTVGGDLWVDGSGAMDIRHTLNVSQDLQLTGGSTVTLEGSVIIGRTLNLTAADTMILGGDWTVAWNATSTGATDIAFSGTLEIGGMLTIQTGNDLTLDGTIAVTRATLLTVGGDLLLSGAFNAVGGGTFTVTGLTTVDAILTANVALLVDGTGAIDWRDDLQAKTDLEFIAASTLTLTGTVNVTGNFTVGAAGLVTINGDVSTGGVATIATDTSFGLTGTLAVLGALNIESAGDTTVNGTVTVQGLSTFTVGGALAMTGIYTGASTSVFTVRGSTQIDAVVAIGLDFALNGDGAIDLREDLDVTGQLTVAGGASIGMHGTIFAGGAVTVSSLGEDGVVTIGATLTTDDLLAIASAGSAILSGEYLVAGTATFSAATDLSFAGTLTVRGEFETTVGSDLILGGTVTVLGASNLTAGGQLTMTGGYTGNDDMTVIAGGDTTVNAIVAITGSLSMDSGGTMDIRNDVHATAGILLSADGSIALFGTLASGSTLAIDAGGDLSLEADVSSGGSVNLLAAMDFDFVGSLISRGVLTVNAGGGTTASGAIEVAGTSLLASGADTRISGTYLAGNTVTLTAGGAATFEGTLHVTGDLSVSANGAMDLSDEIAVSGSLVLDGESTVALTGIVSAGFALTVSALDSLTLDGAASAGGDTTFETNGNFSLVGSLDIGGLLDLDAVGDTNFDGTVEVAKTVMLRVGANLTVAGAFTAGDAVTATVTGATTFDATVVVTGDLSLAGTGIIDLRDAFTIGGVATLGGGNLVSITGTFAANTLDVVAIGHLNLIADVSSVGNSSFDTGGNLSLSGTLAIGGALAGQSTGSMDLSGAIEVSENSSLVSGAGLAIAGIYTVGGEASHVVAGAVSIIAKADVGGGLVIDADSDVLVREEMIVTGGVTIDSGGALTITATLSAGMGLKLTSPGAMSLGHTISAGGEATLTTGAGFTFSGVLDVGAALAIDAGNDAAVGGVATAGGDIAVNVAAGSFTMSSVSQLISEAGGVVISVSESVVLGGIQAVSAVTVTAGEGSISRAGPDHVTIDTLGAIQLSAKNGIGQTGTGTLSLSGSTLGFTNTGAGSVYLVVTGATTLTSGNLTGAGNLYLETRGGSLTVTGPIRVVGGTAMLRVGGALTLAGGVLANGDVRISAVSVTASTTFDTLGPLVRSETGDVQVRAATGLTLVSGSRIEAPDGAVLMQSESTMTVGVIDAETRINLRSGGDLLAAGLTRLAHELRAASVRLFVAGNLGTEEMPILSSADRLDFKAAGRAEIFEADDLDLGRYGIRLADQGTNRVLRLTLGEGELTSVNGRAVISGADTFILRSVETVTLSSRLVSPDGDIVIDTFGLRVGLNPPEALLSAINGSLSLYVGEGALGTGLTLSAEVFEARVGVGNFAVGILGTTRIGLGGIELLDAVGNVALDVSGGDLNLSGVVTATGGVVIHADDGGLHVLNDAPAGTVINAGEAGVALELGTGVVSSVPSGRVEVLGGTFTAITTTGDLRFSLNGPLTKIGEAGIHILGGTGELDVRAPAANIQMFGDIRHEGSGNTSIELLNGSFVMEAGSQWSTADGNLDLTVRNQIIISEIFNLTGATTITSTESSILRQTQVPTGVPNVTALIGPVFSMSGTINILLDSPETIVNGKHVERSELEAYLLILGTYR